MKLYKQVPVDRCTNRQMPLGCGAPEADHPLNMSGVFHEYQGGAVKYVEADDADIEEAWRESGY